MWPDEGVVTPWPNEASLQASALYNGTMFYLCSKERKLNKNANYLSKIESQIHRPFRLISYQTCLKSSRLQSPFVCATFSTSPA